MNVDFDENPYPSENERSQFGYEPNQVYVMEDPSKAKDGKHRFRGDSLDDILKHMGDAYIGFEYVNKDLLLDEQDVDGMKEVPAFQNEAVPAELRPGEEWIDTLEDIEEMTREVTDTSFMVTFYNDKRPKEVDILEDELHNTSLTSFPEIKGIQLVSYWPETHQANLIQYNNKVKVPTKPLDDEKEPVESNQNFRTVKYPREEKSIQELLDNHGDWEITKNTLPKHNLPPKIYTDEKGEN